MITTVLEKENTNVLWLDTSMWKPLMRQSYLMEMYQLVAACSDATLKRESPIMQTAGAIVSGVM